MRNEFRTRLVAVLMSAQLGVASMTPALPPHQSKNQNEPKSQRELMKEVRHVLVMLLYYSVFDSLAYRVEGDKVILEGQVVRPSIKSDAEAAVKSVAGVSSVENNIEVLPPAPMDDQLRRALYRAIYSEPSLSKYSYSAVASIHIIVKNGNVTLEGVVDSEGDKNLATLRANGEANIFSVKNNLQVTGGSKIVGAAEAYQAASAALLLAIRPVPHLAVSFQTSADLGLELLIPCEQSAAGSAAYSGGSRHHVCNRKT